MYIRNLTSNKIERPKTRVEAQLRGTSVFRHRSYIPICKGSKATGVITDNHDKIYFLIIGLKLILATWA